MKNFYQNKVVWVTGASSGIGESIVKELSNQGAKLVLSARRKEELIRVQKENLLTDENSLIMILDLEDYSKIKNLPKLVIKKFGTIDVVINNGGISQRSYAHDTSLNTYEKLMKVNFFGNIALTLAVLPYLQKQRKGWISSISSLAGKMGVPLRTGYSATKFALTGFYEALRAENDKNGIKICLVYPGFIRTNISKNALLGDGNRQNKLDPAIQNGIDSRECARKILKAIANEKQELIIAGSREKLGLSFNKFFPRLFTKILSKVSVT
ncbi:SDR family oxidoreductase [Leptospira bouyouniensis]|uniref:SDR family oxidoreductase n=1 Tax=Leptospira bouyouniensis TaxID=2484911 RepID=UPI0010912FE1|nr:SDR family oxidoreductase [Leptospira bouyouniensis]TGM79768.1 SDR family oxidoreductase [Leptospira bouyouniensis]